MKMKISILNLILFALACFSSIQAQAQTLTTNYYYGISTIRVLLPAQVPVSTEEMLMKRIVDPGNGYLVELACLRRPGQKAYVSPFFMRVVAGQAQLADTQDVDHPKNFKGTAQLSGPTWNWNLLQFSMDWIPSPSHIDDVNTVTDTQIIARKQILTPNGMLFETYQVDANKISVDEFNTHFSNMGCPALSEYP